MWSPVTPTEGELDRCRTAKSPPLESHHGPWSGPPDCSPRGGGRPEPNDPNVGYWPWIQPHVEIPKRGASRFCVGAHDCRLDVGLRGFGRSSGITRLQAKS